MSYVVLLHPKANKFLEEAEDEIRDRIRKKSPDFNIKSRKGRKVEAFKFLAFENRRLSSHL